MVDSAVSRLRPVMLAAGTTVLGVLPLLQDVFWIALAVTIMLWSYRLLAPAKKNGHTNGATNGHTNGVTANAAG